MRRILSLLLFLTMLLPAILILTACGDNGDPPNEPTKPNPPEDKAPALYLPTAGSFTGHNTENFDTFIYSAPSVEALTAALQLATDRLLDETTDYGTALATVDAAEALFATYTEMFSFAKIRFSENHADPIFAAEYKRLYEATPTVSLAVEKLFCAVAKSKHGPALSQTEYFPSDIVSRYKNGGIYNEQTLPLFEEETRILLESEQISEDTVKITFNNKTDTVKNILSELAGIYGESSDIYQKTALRCQTLFLKAANEKRKTLYLSLLLTRRQIADTLGFESYAELAAQRLGYEASLPYIDAALDAVEQYLLPVYRQLSASGYFTADTAKVEKIKYPEAMLNTLTSFYEAKGGKLFEGYNYLLHKGLFSLGAYGGTRTVKTYGTFLHERRQPFLFIATEGSAADYISVADALGDALFYYFNGEKDTAFATELCTPELASALGLSLRLLTLEGMETALSETESAVEISTYLVLQKSEIYHILRTVLTQSMRTEIELALYALAAEEITAERANAIVASAAERFGCYEMQDGSLESLSLSTEGLLSRDMFSKPMMAFSDLTSAYIALSAFLKENETDGAGFAMLETLLACDLRDGGYTEVLQALSLSHPANAQTVSALAAALYEALTGYSYETLPTLPPSVT